MSDSLLIGRYTDAFRIASDVIRRPKVRPPDGAAPVDRLTPGITTAADATALLLGPHSSERSYPNGQRLLQWGWVAASSADLAARRIAILFGKDGGMVGVIHATAQQEAR